MASDYMGNDLSLRQLKASLPKQHTVELHQEDVEQINERLNDIAAADGKDGFSNEELMTAQEYLHSRGILTTQAGLTRPSLHAFRDHLHYMHIPQDAEICTPPEDAPEAPEADWCCDRVQFSAVITISEKDDEFAITASKISAETMVRDNPKAEMEQITEAD